MTGDLTDFQPFFELHGNEIARGLGNTNSTATLTVSQIKSGDTATVFLVTCEKLDGVLKLFNDSPEGASAYARERDASLIIRGKSLAPSFVQFSDSEKFVMSRFIEAETVENAVLHLQPDTLAYKIGAWIAKFEDTAPSTSAMTDWAQYLSKIDGVSDFSSFPHLSEVLSQFPITELTLSRNDNALSNYLVDKDEQIWGVDFESSMMKPVGWDLCMAAYALTELKSERVDPVIYSLVNGYQSVAETNLIGEFDLEGLCRAVMPVVLEFHANSRGLMFT